MGAGGTEMSTNVFKIFFNLMLPFWFPIGLEAQKKGFSMRSNH